MGSSVHPRPSFLLSAQCCGKTFPFIHLWTRLLFALAGLLYASAIVAHDRRPDYLLRATPWFLISLGRAALDLAVSNQAQQGLTACFSSPPCPCRALLSSCWMEVSPSGQEGGLKPGAGRHNGNVHFVLFPFFFFLMRLIICWLELCETAKGVVKVPGPRIRRASFQSQFCSQVGLVPALYEPVFLIFALPFSQAEKGLCKLTRCAEVTIPSLLFGPGAWVGRAERKVDKGCPSSVTMSTFPVPQGVWPDVLRPW